MVLGIESESRARLSTVLRSCGDIFTPQEAAKALGASAVVTSQYLVRWTKQGWLLRIRRGLYVSVPITAQNSKDVAVDPWVVATRVFSPCYIGGWSAAEHWGLTEQLFRTTVVVTSKVFRKRKVSYLSNEYLIRLVKSGLLFGTKTVWKGKTKVLVSDPAKTIIDMMADPSLGGGAKVVGEMLDAYLKSDGPGAKQLVEYANRMGNGAVYKRLGFFFERAGQADAVLQTIKGKLTPGNARLDLSLPAEKLVTRWRLWVPSNWKESKVD